jgi:hypothetical protein
VSATPPARASALGAVSATPPARASALGAVSATPPARASALGAVRAGTLLVGTLLLAGACGGGRATPQETLDTLRSAVAVQDGPRLYAVHDGITLANRRQMMLDLRAQLARGDDPKEVLRPVGLSAEDVTAGTVEEAVARLFLRNSPFVRHADWFRAATPVGPAEFEGEDIAKLRLRGSDGDERDVWFVRERGKWAIDQARTWAPQ